MKLKLHPVIYVLGIYALLSIYLIISYFSIYQNLVNISVVDLTPIAYIILGLGMTLLVLSVLSILRVPLFHYLFKMLNLWITILLVVSLWLYYKYELLIMDTLATNTQQAIARLFPVSNPDIYKPLAGLLKSGVTSFKSHYLHLLLIVAIVLVIIQIFFYLPASLRYVYHTHISPFFYTFKHFIVSVVLLAALLFGLNFYIKLDSSLNPQLDALLASESQKVSDKENAFLPMLTVWMPGVSNRTATGKAWVRSYNAMIQYFSKSGKPIVPTQYPEYSAQNYAGMDPADRAAINKLYVQRMSEKNFKPGPDIQAYTQRYGYALNALRSLYEYKSYNDPIPYNGFSYTYFLKDYVDNMLALHRLNLLEAMNESGNPRNMVKNVLFSDYFFNLMVIKNSDDPVIKMLFIKKQDITVSFIATLMENPAYQTDALYKFIDYIPIMGKQAMDYSKLARTKMLFFKKLFNSYESSEKSSVVAQHIFDYAFKYNKTLNCVYGKLDNELNLSNIMPADYLKAQQTMQSKARLSNVIGDTICSVSVPKYISSDFIQAVEANGRIIMLKARSKTYEKGIQDFNINVFLTNNSDKYYNPFDKQALHWDRDKKQIYFEYSAGKKTVRVSL